MIEEALSTRSGVLVADEPPEALESRFPGLKPALDAGIRSVIAVPLVSTERVVAALTFASSAAQAFEVDHLRLGQGIGERIADVIARSRLNAALQREVAELAALAEIGRVMSSSPDAADLYERFAQKVGALIPFDRLEIALVVLESDQCTTVCAVGQEIPGWGVGRTFVVNGTPTETILGTRSGLIERGHSPGEWVATYPSEAPTIAAGLSSMIAVPLVSRRQIIAILTLRSTRPHAYTERELALAERIAAQVASTVANSQLYLHVQLEAREQTALVEIGRIVGSSPDFAQVYQHFAEGVRTLVPFDRLVVALLDLEAGKGANAFVGGAEVSASEVGTVYDVDSEFLRSLTSSNRGIIAAADSTEELAARFPHWSSIISDGVRSVLAVPLTFEDQVNAALVWCSIEANAYSEQDLVLARRIGAQVLGSVAKIHQRLPEEGDEGEVLGEIGRIVASANTIDDVYDALAAQIARLIPFDRMEFATIGFNDDALIRTYVSGTEVPDQVQEVTEPLSDTIVEEAIRLRSPFLVRARSAQDMESRFQSLVPAIEAGLRTFLTTPLVSADRVVGTMILASTELNAYAQRDLDLTERVGHQLAGAIADARVRRGQVPDREELDALTDIGRSFNSSVDVGEVFERFAEQVRKLIPFDRITIWTVDLQRQNLVASYTAGVDVPGLERGRVFPLGSPAAKAVFSARSGLTLEERSTGALVDRFPDLFRGTAAGLPAMLLVPLVSGTETIGMLSLRSTTHNAYSKRDVAVAGRIGAQIAGAVANAQVYLESRQMEEAVRQAVERLDMAVRSSGDGLWDWKILENEVWWSPRFKELVGYGRQEEDDGLQGWRARLHSEDRDRVLKSLNDHLERRTPYNVEYRLRAHSGGYSWFNDRGQAIWDEAGKAVRMSGSLRDINDAKEGLAGADDVREPLAAIESFRQALLESRATQQDEDGNISVARLASASGRMAQLTNDLQTLSWAIDSEAGRETVDLSAIARSIARSLRKTHGKRRTTFSIAKGLAAEGDARLLRLMMETLLNNAWKFSGKHPRARIEFGSSEQHGKVVYYVRDDGAGFDMAHVDRLFGLFQRLHPATEFEGNGVGLATARHIVRRHGGSIWAEGQVEQGATFYFSL